MSNCSLIITCGSACSLFNGWILLLTARACEILIRRAKSTSMDSPRGPSTLVDEANHIHASDATSCQTHHWPSSYRPSSMPLSGFWSLRAASESAAGIQPTWSELERLAGFGDASCPIAPLFLAASLPAEAQSRKIVGDSIWHMILAATSEVPPSPRYVDVGRCHMKSLFEAVSQREGASFRLSAVSELPCMLISP